MPWSQGNFRSTLIYVELNSDRKYGMRTRLWENYSGKAKRSLLFSGEGLLSSEHLLVEMSSRSVLGDLEKV